MKRRENRELTKVKRSRRVLSLEDKIKILDLLVQGRKIAEVGRLMGVNESSIRSIKQNQESIRNSVKSGTKSSLKVTRVVRDPHIERTEKTLVTWIEDQNRKNMPINTSIIMTTARILYKHYVEDSGYGEPNKFQASKGWFEKFKKRFSLHNIKLSGESTFTDDDAASQFLNKFKTIIEDNGYLPQQVFNANKIVLFWKRMPSRTSIAKEEERSPVKVTEEMFTLLMCANSSGDFLLKPMLLHNSENPHTLRGKHKAFLPVYWRTNKNASVTTAVLMDWFKNCFVPNVERYLRNKNMDFKVLLILDNDLGHTANELTTHQSIKVIFLPPNTTPSIQPLNQGVMKIFKMHYMRHTFDHIVHNIVSNPDISVEEAWKNISIAHALTFIKASLNDMKQTMLNYAWKNLWKDVVVFDNPSSIDEVVNSVLQSARQIPGEGFEDMSWKDIEDMLELRSEELGVKDREEIIEEREDDNHRAEIFSLANLNTIICCAKELIDKVVETDPSAERSENFKNGLQSLLMPYKKLHKKLSRHPMPYSFSKPSTSRSQSNSTPDFAKFQEDNSSSSET